MNWYLTVGVESKDSTTNTQEKGIGIDLGIKDLAICSNGNKYQSINKTQKAKKMNKLQEDFKKFDNKAQNLLNQYVNDKINDKYFLSTLCLIDERRKNIQKQINSLGNKTINDFLDLTPAEQYRFIHEHLKRINVDIDTRIVISIEYNNH